jgi:hypothetical protein
MWVQYYDVMTDGINDIYSPFIGLIFTFIGIMLFIWGFISRNKPASEVGDAGSPLFFGFLMATISLLVVVSLHKGRKSEYYLFETILKQHKYLVLEGCIENFIPQNAEGTYPKREKFTIKNIPFEYSSNASVSYNIPKYKGGVIDSNKYVRIHYYEGEILRLWVLEETKK